jgi:exonuclease VII small subunit
MEGIMKNPYEEEAARYREALRCVESIVDRLAETDPPRPSHQSRRLRKVTPAVIRRSIAALRSGEMRPADPFRDPIALAAELEETLALISVLEQALLMLNRSIDGLTSRIAKKEEKPLAEAMEVFRKARELARTSGDENLKEHVRRMNRALGRGPRR